MSDSDGAQQLRDLLQNQSYQAPSTPSTSRKDGPSTSADIPVLDELAALIGSLDTHQISSSNQTTPLVDREQYLASSEVGDVKYCCSSCDCLKF